MIIAISGLAGAGKDSIADLLAKGAWVKCALADPLKRIARDVFDFTDEQLWGPSSKRNEPDKRYPREHTWVEDKCLCCGATFPALRAYPNGQWKRDEPIQCYLTCRYALQQLGTEYGRHCFPDIWVNYAIRTHDRLQKGGCYYDQKSGMRFTSSFDGETWVAPKKNTVVPDTRFKNELSLIKAAGGLAIRVTRPGVEVPAWQHASETEQMEIPDSAFDFVLRNDGSLSDLEGKVAAMCEKLSV